MFLGKLSVMKSDWRRLIAAALFTGMTLASAIGQTNPNRSTQNVSTTDLAQKLAADTHHLEDLQRQRRQLLAANQDSSSSVPAQDFSPDHKTRKDLVEELVQLLKMSKDDQSESSEAIALRHKITRLQTELSEGDARNSPPQQVDDRANQFALWKLRSQIALSQADVLADQQALAKSSQSNSPSNGAQSNSGAGSTTSILKQPDSDSSQHQTFSASERHVLIILGALLASVILGLLSYVLFMRWLPKKPDAISSVEALQSSLAGAANFIGSIPRMKAR